MNMARTNEFVDPDYDRRLAEFKAMRDKHRQEQQAQPKRDNFQKKGF
jgi:hypothetical protein